MMKLHGVVVFRIAAITAALNMVDGTAVGQSGGGRQAQAGQLHRFTEIKGFDVQTQDGQRCGKIHNAALDLNNARPVYFLVNTSGIDDLGEKLIPVPTAAMDFTRINQRQARININMDRFKDAPDFNPTGWQTMDDANWGRKVHQHYGVDWIEPGRSVSGQDQPNMLVNAADMPTLRLFARQREEIGKCEDVLIDTHRGAAPLLLINTEGQQSKELVAIPTPLVRYNAGQKELIAQIDKGQLSGAPRFTENSQFRDQERIQRVFAHFNVDPDTIYGYSSPSAGSDGGGGGGSDADRSESWRFDSQYGRLFESSRMTTIDGRITAVERKRPMEGMGPGVVFTIRDSEGRTHEVHLGPAWFIERQVSMLRDGDQVTIRGSQASHGGQAFIMATQVRREGNVMVLRNRDGMPAWDAWREASELRDES